MLRNWTPTSFFLLYYFALWSLFCSLLFSISLSNVFSQPECLGLRYYFQTLEDRVQMLFGIFSRQICCSSYVSSVHDLILPNSTTRILTEVSGHQGMAKLNPQIRVYLDILRKKCNIYVSATFFFSLGQLYNAFPVNLRPNDAPFLFLKVINNLAENPLHANKVNAPVM